MIYVVEQNGEAASRGSAVYAYTSRRSAEASARAIGGVVVEYCVGEEPTTSEDATREMLAMRAERDLARSERDELTALLLPAMGEHEGYAQAVRRLRWNTSRLDRLRALVSNLLMQADAEADARVERFIAERKL